MPVILRRDKGSTLTHNELDDNFQELLNRANLDSDLVKKFTLDSADAITLIDSDYIQHRRPPEAVFGVSNNGTAAWRFNGDGFPTGVDNPTLYLHRGLEYKFEMNALGHPLEFRLSNGGTVYTAGVTGRGTQVGDITFTPPFDAPSSLVYQCNNHSAMVGDIVILDKMDSDSVTSLIDSAYIQQRVPESYLETLIDSDYVQDRVTLRDSSFVTGLVDSSYLSGFIDSNYVSSRQSGGGFNIHYFTTTGTVTKVGDGDVLVEIAGGGGGGTNVGVMAGNSPARGGNSHGRAILNNVADGSVITISAIGAGGTNNPTTNGGTTIVYVDSANGQSVSMPGGQRGYLQSNPYSSSSSAVNGTPALNPTVSGGATSLYGWNDGTGGGESKNTGFGKYSGSSTPVGRGIGGIVYSSTSNGGTAGAVLLIGV